MCVSFDLLIHFLAQQEPALSVSLSLCLCLAVCLSLALSLSDICYSQTDGQTEAKGGVGGRYVTEQTKTTHKLRLWSK